MQKYNLTIEEAILKYYKTLNEKQRRHYASLEAQKLGRGGKTYISSLLKITQKTLRKGESELKNEELFKQIPSEKQRRIGGGKKKRL